MEMIKKIKEFLISLLPLILIGNFFLIAIYYLIGYVEENKFHNNLIDVEPIFLTVNFSLIIISFILNLKDIKKILKPIKKSSWLILILIFIIGFYLRMYLVPKTQRVFFDGDIYLDIGKQILTEGKACLCNYGDYKGCYDCVLMKWPNGFPFTAAVTFFFFGISEAVAYNMIIFLGSISTVLVFLIGYFLSNEVKIGLFSALIFALIPMHIVWSASIASEPVFVFYALLSVFATLLAVKFSDWKSNLFMIGSLAFAMQLKTESGALLAVIALIIILFDKKMKFKLNKINFLVPWMIFLILITPYLIHTYHSSRTDPWGSEGKKFGFEFAKDNITTNGLYWLMGYETIEHPAFFSILAIIGSVFMFKKEKKIISFLVLWFMIFFMIYAFFYAGSVRYGTDVRYSLIGYPPFVLLSGYGLFFIHQTINKKIKKDNLVFFILLIIVLLSFLPYAKSIGTPAEEIQEANQARIYHEFAVEFAKGLDKNCYVLSHVPSIYLLLERGSLQTWNGQNENVMGELFQKSDCVIFDDGFWCNIEPYKSSVCKHVFDKYNIVDIASVTAMGGKPTYTMYKVENPYK